MAFCKLLAETPESSQLHIVNGAYAVALKREHQPDNQGKKQPAQAGYFCPGSNFRE
jgi:hypothetical protein